MSSAPRRLSLGDEGLGHESCQKFPSKRHLAVLKFEFGLEPVLSAYQDSSPSTRVSRFKNIRVVANRDVRIQRVGSFVPKRQPSLGCPRKIYGGK